MKSKLIIINFFLFLIFFVGGFYYHEYVFQEEYERAYSTEGINCSTLNKTLDKISINYVDQEKINIQEMTEGAISGMVKALGDPYTEYFNAEETRNLQESISGKFEGIGLQVGIKDNQITSISPIKGTPAEKAGMKPKDIILFVDEKSTSEMSLDEAVSLIRGKRGTTVKLTILRDESQKDIEIVRDVINVPTLDWEIIESQKGEKIAHLTIYHFSETTYQDFKKAAITISNSGIKGIILDLRSNPGGLVSQAINIAGWFLEKGEIAMLEKDKNGKETQSRTNGPSSFYSYPTVVLIDEGSASASEILAGALKDNNGTLMIGKKSFGKGTVQKIIDLGKETSLKITIAKWLTPNGSIIDEEGIFPDVEVEITLEDYKNEKDPQLEKALEEVEKLIK
jgi:carboxyl-terminal processing protease